MESSKEELDKIREKVSDLQEELDKEKRRRKQLEKQLEDQKGIQNVSREVDSSESFEEGKISRRSFMKKTGIGALGLGVLSLSPVSSQLKLTKDRIFSSSGGSIGMNGDMLDLSGSKLNRSNIPVFAVQKYAEGGQSLPTIENFSRESIDNNNNFDESNYKFVAPTEGFYFFHTRLREEEHYGELGVVSIEFLKNDSNVIARGRFDLNDNEVSGQLTHIAELSEGDEIKVRWDSDNIDTGDLERNGRRTFFYGFMISAV